MVSVQKHMSTNLFKVYEYTLATAREKGVPSDLREFMKDLGSTLKTHVWNDQMKEFQAKIDESILKVLEEDEDGLEGWMTAFKVKKLKRRSTSSLRKRYLKLTS